jgi:hypothetical protein
LLFVQNVTALRSFFDGRTFEIGEVLS